MSSFQDSMELHALYTGLADLGYDMMALQAI